MFLNNSIAPGWRNRSADYLFLLARTIFEAVDSATFSLLIEVGLARDEPIPSPSNI